MSNDTQHTRPSSLVMVGFIGLIVAMVWKILFLDGLNPFGVTFVVLFVGTTIALMLVHARWVLLVAAAVAAFAVVGAFQDPVFEVAMDDPAANLGHTAATVVQVLSGALGCVAAIRGAARRRREDTVDVASRPR